MFVRKKKYEELLKKHLELEHRHLCLENYNTRIKAELETLRKAMEAPGLITMVRPDPINNDPLTKRVYAEQTVNFMRLVECSSDERESIIKHIVVDVQYGISDALEAFIRNELKLLNQNK